MPGVNVRIARCGRPTSCIAHFLCRSLRSHFRAKRAQSNLPLPAALNSGATIKELIVAIAAFMFVLIACAAESILGEYHADTKSDWGWTLVLSEGFSGKIISTEFPNECELCERIEVAEKGVWSISENRIALVLSTGKEYIFRIEGEDRLVLVEPSFPEIEPGKLVLRKGI